jgi:predicted 3-demethylubiquinone-9 3-methyltransferase (glyoxalase superfamily)
MQRITPFLWFDNQAEEAVNFYVSLFKNSKVESISRYQEGPMKGKVLTAVFHLEGQQFMALDGGPQFKFTEAISLLVDCQTQEEVDKLWDRLSEGGDPEAQRCGWLKDRFGVSWQIVPTALPGLLTDPDPEKSRRVMEAMFPMKKIDIAELQRAYEAR